MLTTQEIFDKVAGHLLKQGERSVSKDGECAYRGTNGMMCAAGCLISDEDYEQRFEGLRFWAISVANNYQEEQKDFIGELQVLHDQHDPKYWKRSLNRLAEKYNLKGIS